ncbi:DAK2 domain-containing protein [Acrocarpospora catenulata]|uniref:DAK2 domain-containing protein n=1 Tax=Acrocarpospora catenulata TaxID=2836182 RepID=UPI001BD9CE1D|nr:DAK2 domain-containing protein [Acrocarpospora catenulata]
MLEVLDPAAVRRWARWSAEALSGARAEIDALNVFPVPDGDTGTNLHLTLLAAAEALDALPPDAGPDKTWQTLAHGALLGARGNSGVIVSQALRGLAEALRQAEGRGGDLRNGLVLAARLARDAVVRPVEGTVLSVLAAVAAAVPEGDLGAVATAAAREGRRALGRTTGQLDVLARSGVVDAGAAGLVILLETLAEVVLEARADQHEVPAPQTRVTPPTTEGDAGYEVMYLLHADDTSIDRLRGELDRLGESLVIVGGDGLWNVHVHTDDAGAAIEAALEVGRPYRIRVSHLGGGAPRARRGVVAVAAGTGLAALFQQAGAVVVRREPGSSPPLAALLEAIREAGTEVSVLPNDTGVRAVAAAAAEIARDEGLTVSVLPTKASVQGLAALAVHDPLRRFDDDVVAMTDAAGHTRHGHVWMANREAMTSAGLCRPGDVLGVVDGDVSLIGTALAPVAVEVVRRMVSASSELVTLVSGADAPESLVRAVEDYLAVERPDIEVVRVAGGQGGYPLLIGVE